MKTSLSLSFFLAGIALMGFAGFPSPALSQTINPAIVQKTLNPLPNSVLIPRSAFSGSLISLIPAPGTGADGVTAEVNFVWSGTSGDLTNDGYPEVAISGWSIRPGFNNATGTPLPTPLYVFSTNAAGTVQLDPQPLFGISSLPGTNAHRILDLDKNGLNDFIYLGYNESPFTATISQEFLQTTPGAFFTVTLPGPKVASHNSNVGDFNGDGYPDIIASTYMTDGTYFDPAFFAFRTAKNVMILYINNRDGTFTPHAMRYTKPISQGPSQPDYGGGGSASAIGDLDGDGKSEIVMVDPQVVLGTNNITRGDTFIISNITLGNGEAYGDVTKLPAPYFEDKPEYSGYPSLFGESKSHDIHVDIRDINNDGRPDILVSSIIWSLGTGTLGGVLQILLNKGNRQFEDITDTSLYNFFLGKSSGHQVEFMDVNGDGFPDIIMPQVGYFGPPAVSAQTWANQVLINTGTGKFVQAMWNEFHEMTLSQEQLVPGGGFLRQDWKYIPYPLPDRRLGFIASQYVFLNGVPKLGFFDFRAQTPLSTGPNGTDPALQGAPGFSEYFYLTEYPDVAAAVAAGQYSNGLAHYLSTGRSQGREAFAPNATIRGSAQVGTVTLNGPRSNFSLTKIAGGFQLKDNVGRYGTLTLLDVERVQFSDTTIGLGLPLAAAVLPLSRSIQIGSTATAFATIINAGADTTFGCGISAITSIPASFVFQTTHPATNQVTGNPNTPVDIPPGAAQSFVFAFTPTATIAPTEVQLNFDCANSSTVPTLSGINTLLFSAALTPVPDIVALAATLINDGIVNVPGATGTGAFAVATVNVGATGTITASADTGSAVLPVSINLCETNPATGQCISSIGPSVTTQINANATPTFGIFVQGNGDVPFDPAANRIFVRFEDGGGVTRGSTSVAIRTQ
jgi:hypothetical protein